MSLEWRRVFSGKLGSNWKAFCSAPTTMERACKDHRATPAYGAIGSKEIPFRSVQGGRLHHGSHDCQVLGMECRHQSQAVVCLGRRWVGIADTGQRFADIHDYLRIGCGEKAVYDRLRLWSVPIDRPWQLRDLSGLRWWRL